MTVGTFIVDTMTRVMTAYQDDTHIDSLDDIFSKSMDDRPDVSLYIAGESTLLYAQNRKASLTLS
jgi:hypothetical protein